MCLENLAQELGRESSFRLGHLLGGAGGEDGAAASPAFGAEVDDVVGALDDVEVVLDDDDGVALVDQALQHAQQHADVLEMQPGGGLVEDVERTARVALRELGGQLHALALAAGERRGRLPEPEVAEAYVLQRLDFLKDVGHVLEELHGAVDGHVEDVGDGLALEAHLQGLAVVATAVALLAGRHDVGQEVHLDRLVAVAAAGLAAAAFDVEREAPGLVAADACLGQRDEEVADVREDAGVGGGVGARGAAYGALVYVDDLVDVLKPDDVVVGQGVAQRAVEVLREDGLQRVVDERGLARA